MPKEKKNNTPKDMITMSVNPGNLEVREEKITDSELLKKVIRGYAVVFDDVYKYRDWETGEEWVEKVDPKAFDEVDFERTVFLRDHNFERILGRYGKNLRLEVDDKGLFFEVDLPDTELARETWELVRAEICDQMSFGFTVKEIVHDYGNRVSTIKKVDRLYEITATPIPAYKGTVMVTMCDKRNEQNRIETEKRAKDEAEAKKREAESSRLEEEKREARMMLLYERIKKSMED